MASPDVFSTFNVLPVTTGNALLAKWAFTTNFLTEMSDSTSIPEFLYLLVTDYGVVGAGNTISSVVVVPMKDMSGNLTTSYTISSNTPGLTFQIQNGTKYHIMAQIIYVKQDQMYTSNSDQSIQMCSTIPQVPNFDIYASTNSFTIQLLNAPAPNGVPPTPISEFDGYSVLKGIFVTYASKTQL